MSRTFNLTRLVLLGGVVCLASLLALVLLDAPTEAFATLGDVSMWMLGGAAAGTAAHGARHVKPGQPEAPAEPTP